MVVVTKDNFIEQSNDFLHHLPTAAFVAVDEEMTGISLPNTNPHSSRRSAKDDPPYQQYRELKKVPETYSIIQLGVSLFHYTGGYSASSNSATATLPQQHPTSSRTSATATTTDNLSSNKVTSTQPRARSETAAGPDWTVRRYNFFSFPGKDSDRSVVLNPAAVAFLHQHNISFDKWTKEGIPFQTESKAESTLQDYLKKELAAVADQSEAPKQPTVAEASRRKVQFHRTEDIDFFSRAMAGLRTWLDSPIPTPDPEHGSPEEGAFFLLPECNSFLRRALYESIHQEYPSLTLEKDPNSYCIRVWRLSDEEKERRERRLRKEAWQNLIVEQVGLYRIFHALSHAGRGFALERDTPLMAACIDDIDWMKERSLYRGPKQRKIPIIVHNGFMDLCFLLSHFVQPQLPGTLSQCKDLIRRYFPVIYDTKIMALEYSPVHYHENTRLGLLFSSVKSKIEGQVHVMMSDLEQMQEDGGTHAAIPEEEHFADYDAYMTGICFLGICQSILRSATYSNGDVGVAGPGVGTLVHLTAPMDDPQVRKYFGRNILHQMSIYNLDLEDRNGDPLRHGMRLESTIRVSGIVQSTTTRDIVVSVSGMHDAARRPVNFEIIWIDDTTFLVAAATRGNDRDDDADNNIAILLDHGLMIQNALKRRFEDSTVITLQEHLRNIELGIEVRNRSGATTNNKDGTTLSSLASKFFSWVGMGGGPATNNYINSSYNEGSHLKKRKVSA